MENPFQNPSSFPKVPDVCETAERENITDKNEQVSCPGCALYASGLYSGIRPCCEYASVCPVLCSDWLCALPRPPLQEKTTNTFSCSTLTHIICTTKRN